MRVGGGYAAGGLVVNCVPEKVGCAGGLVGGKRICSTGKGIGQEKDTGAISGEDTAAPGEELRGSGELRDPRRRVEREGDAVVFSEVVGAWEAA